ncbi:hypothetical protein P691DRAFT_671944, partial [Macrolepiota fuliginosa MF-IS2]
LYPQCHLLKNIINESHEDGGSFSDVFKGRHGNYILCLEVVRLHQKADVDSALKAYTREMILWGGMRHPNIMPFYGTFYLDEECKKLCLLSPWMNNGNVVDYLKKNPDVDREPSIYDIALGLGYLQEQKLVHSDLKGVRKVLIQPSKATSGLLVAFILRCVHRPLPSSHVDQTSNGRY